MGAAVAENATALDKRLRVQLQNLCAHGARRADPAERRDQNDQVRGRAAKKRRQNNERNELWKQDKNLNQAIEKLMHNMLEVITEVESMDADRIDTLNAISTISGVTEETLAATNLVNEQIREQLNIMNGLSDATTQLNENTTELTDAVSRFHL